MRNSKALPLEVLEAIKALTDMGFNWDPETIPRYVETDTRGYPSRYQEVLSSFKGGHYEMLDIDGVEPPFKITGNGKRYYSLDHDIVPFEKRLAYVFEYRGYRFAVFHPAVARSLSERLAVDGVSDPEQYTSRLREVIKNAPPVQVEGYAEETFFLVVPLEIIKNFDKFLEKFAHRYRSEGPIDYVITMERADYTTLPRYFPSLEFVYSYFFSLLSVTSVEDMLFVYFAATSWARVEALYGFLRNHLPKGASKLILFSPPDKYTAGERFVPFGRPDPIPRPLRYAEVAHFYNKDLKDYEWEGYPLGVWKEKDEKVYREAIRTFAYVEEQLKKWKATSFPSDIILRKYL